MATRSARHTILSEPATFDAKTGELRVVIKTLKGSRNKCDYDPDCDCLDLGTVLPEGMSIPFDFGFVPSTLGEDGDPLDILILMDAPVVPGCVKRARAVGAIEAKQKAKGESWQRNDRLIAVATHAQTHENVKSLADLRPHLVEEIKAFQTASLGRSRQIAKADRPPERRNLAPQTMFYSKRGPKRRLP